MTKALRLFIIYAREDETFRAELKAQLTPMERAGEIHVWTDRELLAGDPWEPAIKAQLRQADIILLLVSTDYFQSDYIHEVEIKEALERHQKGEARVIPVILRPCIWESDSVISSLQILPSDGIPVNDTRHWHTRDAAWVDVVCGLRKTIQQLQAERAEAARNKQDARNAAEQIRLKTAAEAERQQAETARAAARLYKSQTKAPNEKRKLITLFTGMGIVALLSLASYIAFFKDTGTLNSKTVSNTLEIPLPTMIAIAGGTFSMGSNDGNSDEKPVRTVRLKSFYLSRYETTNAEFCAFLNEKGNQSEGGTEWIALDGSYQSEKCRILKKSNRFSVESGYERHPVIYVSWYGAAAYCKWLSEKTGQTWRLPSESEWEYAARGGEAGAKDGYKYAGSNDVDAVAWYTTNTKNIGTRPVGTKKPNQLGLNDMSGNVLEWCADAWHGTYESAPTDGSAWTAGGDQSHAVLRGGSWFEIVHFCRSATRDRDSRDHRLRLVGFRVARGGEAN